MRKQKHKTFGSVFADHIANFIEMRRGMGYRSKNQIDILFNFDRYLKERDYRGALTLELAQDFATSNPRLSKNWSVQKYRAIQQFSVYLSAFVSDSLPLPTRKLKAQEALGRPTDKTPQSILADHISNFIALKKGMGYQFERQALILLQFDRYLHDMGYQGVLTQELALDFATSNPRLSKKWSALKYSVVQQFSVYLSAAVSDTLPLPSRKLMAQKAKNKTPKSIFADHIPNFIALKKRMGYQFERQALILLQFDRYLHDMGYQGVLTQELALDFATSNPRLSKKWSALKYSVVQQFSVYLSAVVSDTLPLPSRKLMAQKALGRSTDKTPQSIFADHITNFIALKKGMGYRFENQTMILLQFDRHLHEMAYQGPLTQELALNFATSKPLMSKNQCVRRYQVILQFADYLAVFMPDTPLLRPDVLMRTRGRPPAHIFTDEEMTLLMNGARRVSRVNPLLNVTLHTIIGLAASTGLRVGEVAALDRDDVNLETGILTVRRSKFQKDRLVPVHPTTLKVLRDYVPVRDAWLPHLETLAFFVNTRHQRFVKGTIGNSFHRLADEVGVRKAAGSAPRFHDLRHTFAVRRLVAWYREGKDVQAMLPLLATYMGHVDYSKTAYYLTATAELLSVAAERYETFLDKEAKQ